MKDKNLQIPINQEEISSYLKDIRKLKVMTVERERELSELICSDNISERERQRIYKELLEGNLRFVITVAKRGAGEILLTSMDRDGTKDGFDLTLTAAVINSVVAILPT